jgi:two-component system sensor histidine kinase PilS (NtrC family)
VPSSSGDVAVAAADLRVRLLWLTLFRTVATTLVLGVLAAQLSSGPARTELSAADLTSFGIIGFSFVLTLITALLLRAGRVGRGAAWTQIVFDVLLAASVVSLTGGARSPFTFLFLVSIIGASVLLGTRGAVAGFVGAGTAYVLVLATLSGAHPGDAIPQFGLDAVIQLMAQLLIAVLSGYVGEQLSSTGGRLKASERDLKELTQLQDEIVRAMPSGLVTCDGEGMVSFLNPSAEAILGVTSEQVVRERPIDALIPGANALQPGRRAELNVETPRGARTLGLSIAPLSNERGSLIVFQDLTELRRVEKELDRIDHLATLGRLSAQLAHEIRNPLAAMRGSAQMLVADAAGPGSRLANVIVRESDRLAALVESYLELARPPPPQLVETRVDVVVRETLDLLRADASFAGVPVDEALDAVSAHCDGGQLRQVLLNLLRNAAVAISGKRGRIRIRVAALNPGALIEVWDSAGSLAPEDRQRVFEPFFSRAQGGTGLGLSTVHTIVQAHGGTISVESNPATGTTFSVKLPN